MVIQGDKYLYMLLYHFIASGLCPILHPLLHYPPVLLFLFLKQAGEGLFQCRKPAWVIDGHAGKRCTIIYDPCKSFGKLVKLLLPSICRADNIRCCEIVDVPQRNAG
nr:MAG TPA: hypothetical protein [Caudoviricetes sp.]